MPFQGQTIAQLGERRLVCRAGDISVGGMQIFSPLAGQVGQFVRIAFQLDEAGQWLDADALLVSQVRVTRVFSWGLQFQALPTHVAGLIASFIEERTGASLVPPASAMVRPPAAPAPRRPSRPPAGGADTPTSLVRDRRATPVVASPPSPAEEPRGTARGTPAVSPREPSQPAAVAGLPPRDAPTVKTPSPLTAPRPATVKTPNPLNAPRPVTVKTPNPLNAPQPSAVRGSPSQPSVPVAAAAADLPARNAPTLKAPNPLSPPPVEAPPLAVKPPAADVPRGATPAQGVPATRPRGATPAQGAPASAAQGATLHGAPLVPPAQGERPRGATPALGSPVAPRGSTPPRGAPTQLTPPLSRLPTGPVPPASVAAGRNTKPKAAAAVEEPDLLDGYAKASLRDLYAQALESVDSGKPKKKKK